MKIQGVNGVVADVTTTGHLQVQSISQSSAEVLNIQGLVFRVSGEATPTSADDFFFYLKNEGTNDLALSSIAVSSDVPTKVTMQAVTGEAVLVSETSAAIVNLNLGSSISLPVTTGFAASITGLTSNGQLSFQECAVADTLYEDDISSAVFIPQGKAIAFRRTESTGLITLSIGIAIVPL